MPGTIHCAYCLKGISDGTSVKRCGKCNRRPYCSRECQVIDWNHNQKGQCHKLWCGKAYGEEDEDWEVVPVEHGLGVVALRPIPIHFPIIVERGLENENLHMGIHDLLPDGGSLAEKWELNRMGTLVGKSVLALRIVRANHHCAPNASHYYDEINGLKILIANRDIAVGEEICISYTNFGDVSETDMSAEEHREVLSRKWHIQCPPDCFCYNQDFITALEEAKVLDFAVMDFGRNRQTELAISAGEDLLKYHRLYNSGYASMARTYYDLFQICITKRKFLAIGLQYLYQAYVLSTQCTGQRSDSSVKYASLLDDVSQHNAFLLFDEDDDGQEDGHEDGDNSEKVGYEEIDPETTTRTAKQKKSKHRKRKPSSNTKNNGDNTSPAVVST